MKQDQFKQRYVIKLLSSVVIALLNLVIQFVLPRAFSVEQYAYYSYNLNVFTSVVGIANLSASNALVSKFARRNEEIGLVWFYLGFYIAELLALNLGVMLLFPLKVMRESFAGQTFFVVLLGLEAAAINKLLADVIGLYDAMAVSRVPAVFQIILKVLVSTVVLFGYWSERLDLKLFYICQISVTLLVSCGLLALIIRFQKQKYREIINRGIKAYTKEYYIFCKPLVVSNVVSQMIVIMMNWSLMKWSGAQGQAMFGAAWQINTLVSYIFSPFAELSKREYAVVIDNVKSLQDMFGRSLRLVTWLTAYFALFVGFCADWFLPLIYGDKYAGAALVTLLIMVYTVFQAGGQICGSFMLAVEWTKANAWWGMFGQIAALACMFLFQIPNDIWKQGLGSTGIALTYMVPNVISVSVGIFYIAYKLGLPKLKTACVPFCPFFLCSSVAFALNVAANKIISTDVSGALLIKILLSGAVYTGVLGAVVLKKPWLAGMTKASFRFWRRW